LRDYGTPGQIGSEPSWQEWLANLIDCTREWARVLKPSGSLFVNLGDKFSGAQQQTHGRQSAEASSSYWQRTDPKRTGVPAKSLLGLPWRYALACTDQLGLILRRDIIWAKPNGLPESVTDRCRSSHEYLFHLVKQPRYYAAVDEIRVPHYAPSRKDGGLQNRSYGEAVQFAEGARRWHPKDIAYNALGKLPGSVWEIPSAPLTVPPHLGVDHFAAFPPGLVRPVVLGWSPPGICVACGEGRRPVATPTGRVVASDGRNQFGAYQTRRARGEPEGPQHQSGNGGTAAMPRNERTITGYVCACTPYTDHPGTGEKWRDQRQRTDGRLAGLRCQDPGQRPPLNQLHDYRPVGPWREYHLDGWQPPPTRTAVVLDPFGGTGTTALVATVHGRHAITIDLSADYCRLAQWRTNDPAERARALQVPKPPPVPDGMDALF
jgi:DNA modification methylase